TFSHRYKAMALCLDKKAKIFQQVMESLSETCRVVSSAATGINTLPLRSNFQSLQNILFLPRLQSTLPRNIHDFSSASAGSYATSLSPFASDLTISPSFYTSDQTLLSRDSFALPVSLVDVGSHSSLSNSDEIISRDEIDLNSQIGNNTTLQTFIPEQRNLVQDFEETQPSSINLFGQKKKYITNFCIELNNNRTVFLPGQNIEGPSIKLKLLRLRRSTSTVTIFKDLLTVLGSTLISDPEVEVTAGEYSFPFSFRVPPASLPASFEGFNGYVRYEVTAILVREKHSHRTCSVLITVPSTVDASENEYQCPMGINTRLPVGLFWNMGHIDVNASIPKKAFASEENIPLRLDIANESFVNVTIKEICIKQKITYKMENDYFRVKGPVTEKIHRLKYQVTCNAQMTSRIINIPVPSTSILSPSVRTSILDVKHSVCLKISTNQSSEKSADFGRKFKNMFSFKKSGSYVPDVTVQFQQIHQPFTQHKYENIVSRFDPGRTVKLIIPIIIAGFPHQPDIFIGRPSIDTLPVYSPREDLNFIMERPCLPGDTRTSFELDSLQSNAHNETLMRMVADRSAQVQNLPRIPEDTDSSLVMENSTFENIADSDSISRMEESISIRLGQNQLSMQSRSNSSLSLGTSSFEGDLDDEISLVDSRRSLSPENEISENIRNRTSKGKTPVVFISENANSISEHELGHILRRIDKVGNDQSTSQTSSLRLTSRPSNLSMMSSVSGLTLVERPSNSSLSSNNLSGL
ncbi:hypothetical protein HK096_005818, partial [Nowakowskiella sp. JEL0078]